ncbi:MAG: O-antigen ligase family protein, partial [Chloroflexota bacterium]|nr:O-antigen ligase family protein [Chloroflexota bacterium]
MNVAAGVLRRDLADRPVAHPLVDPFESSRLRQIVLLLIGIKIAGVILILDPWGLQSFDFPKALFSHAASGLLVAALLATFLRFGWGVLPSTRLHLAVVAFLAANIASVLFAQNLYVSLFGEQDRYLGLTHVLDMVVLYFAVAISVRSPRDLASVLAAAATASAFSFAYAGLQLVGLDPFEWSVGARTEPFATFGHPDIFGHFLSISFAVWLGVAAIADVTERPRLVRTFGLFAALVCVGIAAVVATRGTILGAATAVVVLGLLTIRRRGPSVATLRAAAVGAFVALVVLAGVLVFSPLGARTAQLSSDAGSGRLAVYETALKIAIARPVLGYGPDSFGVASPTHREPPPGGGIDPQTSAHSWLLQALATTGIVGLAGLLGVYLVFTLALWRRSITAEGRYAVPLLLGLSAYLAHGLVNVGAVAVDWFPWVCFGAAASMAGVRRPAPARRFPQFVGLPFAIVALAAIVLPFSAFAANRDAGAARVQWTAARSDNAIFAAIGAISHDPGRAVYWNWLGLAKHQAGKWSEAAAAFEEAARRVPSESTYFLNLALARGQQSLSGEDSANTRGAALKAAGRAIDVDPYLPRMSEVADLAFGFGDFDLTLRASAATTAFFDPSYGHRTFLAAREAIDLVQAQQTLSSALSVRETSELRAA